MLNFPLQPPSTLIDVRDRDGNLLFRFCPATLQVHIKQNKRPVRVVDLRPLIETQQPGAILVQKEG